MKKKMIVLIFIAGSCIANAQEAFNSQTKLVTLFVGIGSPYWKSGLKASLPFNPGISFEHGITNNLSAGAGVSYSSSKYDYYDYKVRYTAFFISGRAAWHFPAGEKLDPYAGASLGYTLVTVSSSGYNAAATGGVGYGVFGGVRYYPGKKLGILAEAGYSSFSFLSAGVTFRL